MRTARTRLLFFSLATSHRISQSFPFSRNRTHLSRGIISSTISSTSSSAAAAATTVFSSLPSISLFSSSTGHQDDDEMTTVEDDLYSTTITAAASTSWRSRLEVSMAKSRKIRGSNYVQLSTIAHGANAAEPRCRTVVFRGFLKLSTDHALSNDCDGLATMMKLCTDLRSQKVAQSQSQPIAELVWWFPKTSEQYRIRGRLIMIGNDDQTPEEDKALWMARKELWGNLSDPARESFLGTRVPGAVYEENSNNNDQDSIPIPPGGRDPDGKPVPPPTNFLLMLLDPFHVDYLRLTGEQYRQIDTRTQGNWGLQRVNP